MPSTLRNVAAHEGPAARLPVLSTLAFFFLMTSYYLVRPLRDQLVGAVGASVLPWFYLATLLVVLLLTPLFGWLTARYPPRRLAVWVYGGVAVSLLAFMPAFALQDRIGARSLGLVFFTWVSVFALVVVALFWSLMADLYTNLEARRWFPVIAFGGMGGALFGPLATSLLVPAIGVVPVLAVSALTLAVALGLLLHLTGRSAGQARAARLGEAIGGSLWAGVRQLFTQPFLRYMAILLLLGDAVGTLAYALVADYAKANLHSAPERTVFYSRLDFAINLFGALLQLSITRWLLVRFGAVAGLIVPAVVNMLLLLAIASLGEAHWQVFGIGVSLLVVFQVVTRGTAYGMTKPATDSLYTRVARETRYKGKQVVDTTVWRLGDLVITSGLNLLRELGLGLGSMGLLGTGLAAVAAWLSWRVGRLPGLLPERQGGGPAIGS